jgi:hypothetical protein
MSFSVRTAPRQARTIVARALSFLLLVGLIQAITFGSAHSHSAAGPSIYAGQFAETADQDEYAIPDPYHFQNVRQECLVCLFHQQLFNSVVHTQFFITDPVSLESGASRTKLLKHFNSFNSTVLTRTSGRAPPQN